MFPSTAHDGASSFSSVLTSLRTSEVSRRPEESGKFNAKLIILSEENRAANTCVRVCECVRTQSLINVNMGYTASGFGHCAIFILKNSGFSGPYLFISPPPVQPNRESSQY